MNTFVQNLPTQISGGAKLILVWEDDPSIGRAERAAATDIALACGAKDLGEGPARHWITHRHSVSYRQSPIYAAGGFVDTMEVAAPWSNLEVVHQAVRKAVSPHAFVMAHFSHAYPDGASIYFTFAGGGKDDAECLQKYDALWDAALRATVQAGGTLSHHHGVGRSKAPQLRAEQGVAIDLLHALKRELDPDLILNPGSLLPPREAHKPTRREPPSVIGDPILGFDEHSRTIKVDADMPLTHLENELLNRGYTLGGQLPDCSVAEWIEQGLPGARSTRCDPVDQIVCGIELELPNAETLFIRPAPRRAVGPDLLSVFCGSEGRLGSINAVHLVFRKQHTSQLENYLFADQERTEIAVEKLRAAGVRPLHTRILKHVTGWVLQLAFDRASKVGQAHAERATELISTLQGTALSDSVSERLGMPASPGTHSPLFNALEKCAKAPFES